MLFTELEQEFNNSYSEFVRMSRKGNCVYTLSYTEVFFDADYLGRGTCYTSCYKVVVSPSGQVLHKELVSEDGEDFC